MHQGSQGSLLLRRTTSSPHCHRDFPSISMMPAFLETWLRQRPNSRLGNQPNLPRQYCLGCWAPSRSLPSVPWLGTSWRDVTGKWSKRLVKRSRRRLKQLKQVKHPMSACSTSSVASRWETLISVNSPPLRSMTHLRRSPASRTKPLRRPLSLRLLKRPPSLISWQDYSTNYRQMPARLSLTHLPPSNPTSITSSTGCLGFQVLVPSSNQLWMQFAPNSIPWRQRKDIARGKPSLVE